MKARIFPLYLISCIFCLVSCKQSPVVFSLQTDEVSKHLQLNSDRTFTYKSKHIKSIVFEEEGTYSTTDSSLILHYNNLSFSYNCYEFPLVNDTFLFVPYKEKIYLVYGNQPNEEQRKAFMVSLEQSIKNHTFNLFEEDSYMEHSGGNLKNIQ